MTDKIPEKSTLKIETTRSEGSLVIEMSGHLDSQTVTRVWDEIIGQVKTNYYNKVTIDASGLTYCDTSGISFFIKLSRVQRSSGNSFEIVNMPHEFEQLFNLYTYEEIISEDVEVPEDENIIERFGKDFINFRNEIFGYIEFMGEMIVAMVYATLHPLSVRWKDVFTVAEKVGVNAIAIIAMSNFLVGLIIAFQSAIPMREFGAEFFVSDLVVLSTFRELGPLITAIIINGRSGSAFAAEIGTMKVNEEIDALVTMGINPLRFLVTPKIIAALIMFPALTLVGNLFALIGGGIVMKLLGYTIISYINEIMVAASYTDLLGGLVKSFFFAIIISAIGCKKGLETKSGASAVGDSTTSAVVSGLVLLIIADGIFGVIYFYLDI